MKVFKPMALGLLTRPFEFQRRFRLGVAVLSFVPIGDEPALLSDMSMWKFLAEELPPDLPIDAAIPKIGAEFLVIGQACAPAGTTVPALRVTATLGNARKSLHVFGDRYRHGDRPSDPVPFATLPIDWAHAYGGRGHAENPLGKGIEPEDTPQGRRLPLSNIIDPAEEGGARYRRTAGFWPLDQTWPQRARFVGTYDDTWLNEDFPGFARDINWRFFSLAPAGQQFRDALVGDEAYAFENMHPDAPQLSGKLPGIQPRAFVVRSESDAFEEVKLALTTVWFFPHRMRLVMVHHGHAMLAEEDGADVTRMLIGADLLGQPRDAAGFEAVMQQRADPRKGGMIALRDADLVPRGLLVPDPELAAEEKLSATENLLQKHGRRRTEREIEERRAYVAGFGLDPDVHAPSLPPPEPSPPALETLPALIDQMLADAEREKAEQERMRAEADKEIEKLLEGSGMTMEQLRAERDAKPSGPPVFSAAGKRRELEETSRAFRVLGMDPTHLDEILADPEHAALWERSETELRNIYRLTAHGQDPAQPRDAERRGHVREAIMGAARSWARADLTGLDLSGLNLAGIDLEEAWLDGTDLTGSDLSGANLRNAVLAHATLEGARFDQANLTGANLGRTRMRGASLKDATLVEAVFSDANLQDVVLSGADLSKANLSGARLDSVDLSGAQAADLILMNASIAGIRAAGATLDRLKALHCDLSGADFSGVSAVEAMFLKCRARGMNATGARMPKAVFVEACDFGEAAFVRADLTGANLRGTDFAGVDFSHAVLDDADLSSCDLTGARLHRVRARRARFVAARLEGADLTRADFMNAVLARSDLRSADLTEASLYEADAARVRLDDKSRTRGMLLTRMRYRPRFHA
jgi:uncharacterized protein YjbI with pentapeptide repeats